MHPFFKLILFILPISLWCGMISEPLRTNWYYVTSSLGISCIVFFYNFPFFTKWMHTTPVYFENLEDTNGESPYEKAYYQKCFMIIMNLFLTLIICVLFNYVIYQTHDVQLSPIKIITLLGSICGLHAKVQSNVGSVIMTMLHYSKTKNKKKKIIVIELGNANNV